MFLFFANAVGSHPCSAKDVTLLVLFFFFCFFHFCVVLSCVQYTPVSKNDYKCISHLHINFVSINTKRCFIKKNHFILTVTLAFFDRFL